MPKPYVREPRGNAEASPGWEREWLGGEANATLGKGARRHLEEGKHYALFYLADPKYNGDECV